MCSSTNNTVREALNKSVTPAKAGVEDLEMLNGMTTTEFVQRFLATADVTNE
jgi:hypothetical protein